MTDLDPKPSAADAALGRPERRPGCSLDALTRELRPLLAGGGHRADDGARVAALLRAYAANEETWRPYEVYASETYSRNLLWRDDDFEMLLLCWGEGHESPIHDHAGQQCWMAVLDGELEEVHFQVEDGELNEGRVMSYSAGGVAFIHDDIALHLIRPRAGTRGVSLHLYSDPIDACRIFCPETGRAEPVEVGYHSVRGTLCSGTDPARIRDAWCE